MKYCYIGPLTFALTEANFLGFSVRYQGEKRKLGSEEVLLFRGESAGSSFVQSIPGDRHVKKVGRDLAAKRAKQMEIFILSQYDAATEYFKENKDSKTKIIGGHEFTLEDNEIQIPDSIIREGMKKFYSGRMLQKLKTYLNEKGNKKLYEKFVDKFGGALFEV